MTNRQLARIHRGVRIHLRLRQQDVARRAGIGRWKIVLIEAANIGSLTVDDLRNAFDALGVRLDLTASYQGAGLDRLLDEVHARLVGQVVACLRAIGWSAEVEVSFAIYADRGSIDILAWHPAELALAVFEVKSELASLDGLLRPLDVKVRRAAEVALQRFGWHAVSVSRIVVLPENSASRRAVARHFAVLDQALPLRSREIRRWLRNPRGAIAGVWFLSDDGTADTSRNPSSIRRVRKPKSPTSQALSRSEDQPRGSDSIEMKLIDPHKVGVADR